MPRELRSYTRFGTMFPTREVRELVPRVAAAAWGSMKPSLDIEEVKALAVLNTRLMPIADRFFNERSYRNRPSSDAYKRSFQRLGDNARELVQHIEGMRNEARLQITSAMMHPLSYFRKIDVSALDQNLPLAVVIGLLQEMIKQANYCIEIEGEKTTNRANEHLHWAVAQLKPLWCELTGKSWSKTYGAGRGIDRAPAPTFTSAGPLFVQTVIQALDPEVTLTAIRSAFRAVDRKERASPDRSAQN